MGIQKHYFKQCNAAANPNPHSDAERSNGTSCSPRLENRNLSIIQMETTNLVLLKSVGVKMET